MLQKKSYYSNFKKLFHISIIAESNDNFIRKLLFTCVFIFLFFSFLEVKAQKDYSNYIVNPCQYDNQFVVSWGTMKYKRVCNGTDIHVSCNSGCCFTIAYYEKMQPELIRSDTIYSYLTYISGIFFEGDDCKNCPLDSITKAFQRIIWQQNMTREGFR